MGNTRPLRTAELQKPVKGYACTVRSSKLYSKFIIRLQPVTNQRNVQKQ